MTSGLTVEFLIGFVVIQLDIPRYYLGVVNPRRSILYIRLQIHFRGYRAY